MLNVDSLDLDKVGSALDHRKRTWVDSLERKCSHHSDYLLCWTKILMKKFLKLTLLPKY